MNFTHLASRVAVGGVSAALATAGLVGVTATTASAAAVSTSYTCAIPTVFSGTFPVSADLTLPPGAPAGSPFPTFASSITVPADAQGLLNAVGATGGKSDDFGVSFGGAVTATPVAWNTKTAGATPADPTIYSGTAANAKGITLPKAGTYAVAMPAAFKLIATKADGTSAGELTCTAAAPAQIGSITLAKQESTVKGKATPASSKVGDVVTVKGKVSNEFAKKGGEAVTGKLLVKDGKKTVAKGKVTKKGKFKIKVKGLKAGSHTLVVTYKGDGFTDKAKSKALKVTVKA